MQIHKEIKVALFVIIACVMFYTGFNFLKGIDFFSSRNKYYAEYTHVHGLQVSNPVMINGLSVGRVSEILIMDNAEHTLKITLDIDKKIIIGDSAKAVIASTDLLGGKAIKLEPGNYNKPLPEKTTLIGEVEKDVTEKLTDKLAPVVENLNITIGNLNKLTDAQNLKLINSILNNVDKTTQNLNQLIQKNDPAISKSMTNISQITTSLIHTQKQIDMLLSKTNTFADSLNKMQLAAAINNTSKSLSELQALLAGINKGEGTVGKLIKDDSLYTNLNKVAADLDKLLVDFKQKPKRYVHFSVFGKNDK
ncbi:MAG: MlaD family protein [Cytophagales bacterium]|nr:MlaD family protein [Cytophagales bacterium]